jgi:HlyD family secretion protein
MAPLRMILALVVSVGVIGGIYVIQDEKLSQKFFPEELDLSQYATKPVEMATFRITVEAPGTVDSSRNSTLSSNVEGTTTIISIVSAGEMVFEPLKADVSEDDDVRAEVAAIENLSSGTPTIIINEYKIDEIKDEESGEMVEKKTLLREVPHNYTMLDLSEVIVQVGDVVKNGDILIGDLVCELDSATLVDQEKQQQISVTQAEADLEKGIKNVEIQIAQNESDLAAAKLDEKLADLDLKKYQEGEYVQQVEKIEGEIQQFKEELTRRQKQYEFTKRVERKGYKTQDDVEADRLAMLKAELDLKVKEKELVVLQKYTKERTIAELLAMAKESISQYKRVKLAGEAALAQYRAEVSSRKLTYDVQRAKLDQLRQQIHACKLIAPQAGQVVYAMEASRRSEPSIIEEGMTVRERQKLINLPDMSAMKVDAKIHESKISDVKIGLPVTIRINAIPGYDFQGTLDSVSSVPLPGSWPNYDLKQYESVVKIEETGPMLNQLKPGMSANIEIVVEESNGKLLQMPVQAAVDVGKAYYAWVLTEQGTEPREVKLGRSNDVKFVVESGLEEGEQVITNPRTHFSEEIAKLEAKYAELNPKKPSSRKPKPSVKTEETAKKAEPNQSVAKTDAEKNSGDFDPSAIFTRRDTNGDGVLSGDEISEQMKTNLSKLDSNADGKISKSEFLEAARKISDASPSSGAASGAAE